MNKCAIISLEGMDTSGKGTQAKLLKEYLEGKGHTVHAIHFPRYEKPIGKLIGKILNNKVDSDINPIAMQLLYVADQVDFQTELKKYMEEDCIVILDRYDMSTIVYALSTTDVDLQEMIEYQKRLVKPHLTIVLDIPEEEVAKRKKVLDKFESDQVLQGKIRTNYMIMNFLNNKPVWEDRAVIVVDATKPINEVSEEIIKEVENRWAI